MFFSAVTDGSCIYRKLYLRRLFGIEHCKIIPFYYYSDLFFCAKEQLSYYRSFSYTAMQKKFRTDYLFYLLKTVENIKKGTHDFSKILEIYLWRISLLVKL